MAITLPEISTFYLIGNFFYGYNSAILGEEAVEDKLKNGIHILRPNKTHEQMWKRLVKVNKDDNNSDFAEIIKHDENYYPKWEVVYNIETQRYIVRADKVLVDSEKARKAILKSCNLAKGTRFYVVKEWNCNPESVKDLT